MKYFGEQYYFKTKNNGSKKTIETIYIVAMTFYELCNI